jgi:hypothetical protein
MYADGKVDAVVVMWKISISSRLSPPMIGKASRIELMLNAAIA